MLRFRKDGSFTNRFWKTPLVISLATFALVVAGSVHGEPKSKGEPAPKKENKEDAALERTRKQVRMLDDIYKTAVVLITEHYVNDEADLPAGTAAIALFDAIKKKGWHEVRLIDATGDPVNDENSPTGAFEMTAVKTLKAGGDWYDEVIEKDGKRYLRAATPIPVVLKKCIMCHDHYADVPAGKPIGMLGYTVPIE